MTLTSAMSAVPVSRIVGAFVRDTVNFLEYIGEPVQAKRQSLGFLVIAFLAFFTLLAYALKKEYWKDVK